MFCSIALGLRISESQSRTCIQGCYMRHGYRIFVMVLSPFGEQNSYDERPGDHMKWYIAKKLAISGLDRSGENLGQNHDSHLNNFVEYIHTQAILRYSVILVS